MRRFRLTIDSSLSDVFLVSVLVRGVCDHLGMNASDTFSVDVCAVEAVTNVIRHAYQGARGHDVSLELASTGQRLDVFVRDEGQAIPQMHALKLTQGSDVLQFDATNLAAIPEGGMGLQIIHQLMDEAAYFAEGSTNCLRLTKFLHNPQLLEVGA